MDQWPQTAALARQRLAPMLGHLHEPLSAFMLPHIPAVSLAALRACCQSFQHMVDHLPASLPQAAALALLPPNLNLSFQDDSSSSKLQSLLQTQGRVARQLHLGAGAHIQRLHLRSDLSLQSTMYLRDVHWAPDWPGSAMLARVGKLSDACTFFQFLDPRHINALPCGRIKPNGNEVSLMTWQRNTAILATTAPSYLQLGKSSASEPAGPEMVIPGQHCCIVSPCADAVLLHDRRGRRPTCGSEKGKLTQISLGDFSMRWSSIGPYPTSQFPDSSPIWPSWSPTGHHLAVIWSSGLPGPEMESDSEDEGEVESDTSSEDNICGSSPSFAHRVLDTSSKCLCFHTSKDGEIIGELELGQALFEPYYRCIYSLSVDWSPASNQVLLYIPGKRCIYQVLIANIDGSHMHLDAPNDGFFGPV